jgi:translation initiation factor eIF-2B subunit alpha
METVRALRAQGVPVATIPESAVAYSLGKADVVIVGAEGVVENGGIVSRMGTYQIGLLAKAMGKPFYVVAESHKFVRVYPLGQYDLPIEQHVIDFKTQEEVDTAKQQQSKSAAASSTVQGLNSEFHPDAVDFTPPHLISALITDSGVLTPSAVSEELIKIWF